MHAVITAHANHAAGPAPCRACQHTHHLQAHEQRSAQRSYVPAIAPPQTAQEALLQQEPALHQPPVASHRQQSQPAGIILSLS